MSAPADSYAASTNDYSTSTNCHPHPSSGDDNNHPSAAARKSDGHRDSANADNDGDNMDDSDSEPGFKLSKSW